MSRNFFRVTLPPLSFNPVRCFRVRRLIDSDAAATFRRFAAFAVLRPNVVISSKFRRGPGAEFANIHAPARHARMFVKRRKTPRVPAFTASFHQKGISSSTGGGVAGVSGPALSDPE